MSTIPAEHPRVLDVPRGQVRREFVFRPLSRLAVWASLRSDPSRPAAILC